ncbi:MAG TPA: VacJ family lipoprotein [Oligoflexia bacterium]|nr:VacJ family lipoprotein [Oligoflexia bacterium]HMP26520.1 VacJ family lipoprotein [Oligoflexia bacterium]
MAIRLVFSLFLLCLTSACAATVSNQNGGEVNGSQLVSDPIEPVNRAIFWFNNKVDLNIIEPVAKGYNYVAPNPIQTGVRNFFDNLKFPRYFVSDLVKLDFGGALRQTGRFLINSTVGLLGLVDVAKHFELERNPNDFGLAFAHHGAGSGPYLVLPLLGPSNLRDAIGTVFDLLFDPIFFIGLTNQPLEIDSWLLTGIGALNTIQTRADLIEAINTARESSLDYYMFMQGAYSQYRSGLIQRGDLRGLSREEELAQSRGFSLNSLNSDKGREAKSPFTDDQPFGVD